MADTRNAERNAARQRAQNHFTASEQRDSAIRQEIEQQRAATDALIAKQRALRLAKEEADRIAAASAPPSKTKRGRKAPPASG